MPIKVISGGQTGVDQAALRAARAAGLPTGGWACKGWVTEAGPAPWLADFGLVECPWPGYPARTRWNVGDAGYIVCLETGTFPHWSSGTRLLVNLTQRDLGNGGAKSEPPRAIVELQAIRLGSPIPLPVKAPDYYAMKADGRGWRLGYHQRSPAQVAEEVRKVGASVLMVAGNRESRLPGVGEAAEEYLAQLFALLR